MDEAPADLVRALERAAELEHAVLLQYLFAAASLKRRPADGASLLELERVRGWERTLLAIAREEMAHLAAVSNLLIAVGAAPWLVRPGLPGGRLGGDAGGGGRPGDGRLGDGRLGDCRLGDASRPSGRGDREALVLERFGLPSLARFVGLERQEAGEAGTISGHYAAIKDEIGRLAAAGRPVVCQPALDIVDGWRISGAARFPAVTDAASALAVIDAIVGQGAGHGREDPDSHLERLLAIEAELGREEPGFDPARLVVTDPVLISGPGDATAPVAGTPVGDPRTAAVAGAFAAAYQAMVLLLELYYRLLGASPRAAVGARRVSQGLMTGVLRPLGEVLAELPVGEAAPGWSCGPTFAWDETIGLGADRRESWALLEDMLAGAAANLSAPAGAGGGPPRLGRVAENVALAGRLVAAAGAVDA